MADLEETTSDKDTLDAYNTHVYSDLMYNYQKFDNPKIKKNGEPYDNDDDGFDGDNDDTDNDKNNKDMNFLSAILDLLIPRFITDRVFGVIDETGTFIVIGFIDDHPPEDITEFYKAEVKAFNFLGYAFFPKVHKELN